METDHKVVWSAAQAVYMTRWLDGSSVMGCGMRRRVSQIPRSTNAPQWDWVANGTFRLVVTVRRDLCYGVVQHTVVCGTQTRQLRSAVP